MSIDKLADRLAELVTKLEGPGFEAAKEAARTEALSSLAGGGMAALIAIVGAIAFRWLWRRDDLDETGRIMMLVLAGLAASISAPVAIWSVIDPWVWATLSRPELWLAKKVLGI